MPQCALASASPIRVTADTKQAWLAPLAEHTAVTPNIWLRYFGTQEADGTVTATTLTYAINTLSNHEAKISTKEEFDPSAVTEDDRQGAVSRFLLGANFKRFPAYYMMSGTRIAAAAAGLVVPGLGLAAGVGESVAASKMMKHAQEQSVRVSLSLLHDVGYDITQAPVTWWLLDSKKPRTKTDMPYRARYLYGQLANTWRAE